MDRNITTALIIAAAAVAAALAMASGKAFADDITIESRPFVGTLSRAEVHSDLLRNSKFAREHGTEWAMQLNQGPQVRSAYTSQQVRADYAASREQVRQLNGEDSGSAYLSMSRSNGNSTRTMGSSAH
jgi:hypothetical protein